MMENAATVQSLIIKFSIFLSPFVITNLTGNQNLCCLSVHLLLFILTTNASLPQASLETESSACFFSSHLIFLFSFQQLNTIKLCF